jgi:hypothetical protein
MGSPHLLRKSAQKVDGLRPINARMHLRKVRGVGFGRMTYGGAVDIDPGCLDSFYLVQVPLSGRELIDTSGQTVCSAGKVGSVINATGASLIRHEANTEKLMSALSGRYWSATASSTSAMPCASPSASCPP